MTDEQFRGMFAAQATWDATMGYNAVQAMKKFGDAKTTMVVLIGSGHVAYGLGAERQAALWFDGKMASVIPIPVAAPAARSGPPKIRASYANFIWGVAPEEHPLYPSLGLSHAEQKEGEFFKVIAVQKGSIAERAGFKIGDLLGTMDGVALADKEVFNRLMSEKRWGDAAAFGVKRGAESLTLVANLRRTARAGNDAPQP
jgi:S1-C subfamily serine protease